MRWIDLEHRLPTDNDIPGWTPWDKPQWDAWLAESKRLHNELSQLDATGKQDERNALIDRHSSHWGALKPWLEALSFGKCWFSEVRELYSHYDVEHFRPKEAKALDGNIRDGYWWLAFDYMNFRLCGNVGNRKKGGWFPLRDGSLSSTYGAPCEESETPYLIDPINDYDVGLIAFDEEGKVISMPGICEWEQQRVIESIKRLKLNGHAPLAEERRKIWQKVDRLIEEYFCAKSRLSAGNNPVAVEKIKSICAQIREMTKPTSELSAVAKWCLLLRNDQQLSRLVC